MDIKANSIKVKNIAFMILCALIVPIARVIERHTAASADSAAWLSPLIASLMFAPFAAVLLKIISDNPHMSLSQINDKVFGKAFGKAVNTVYALWFIVLAGYYLCQFSERMATTVYINTNSAIFVSLLIIVLSYSLHKGQETLIRASTLFFYAVVSVFVFSLVCLAPSVNTEYHLPVTKDLIPGIFTGATEIFSVMIYFVTLPFFLDKVKTGNVRRSLLSGGTAALLLSAFTIFVTVGLFSAPVVATMPFPFFSAVKEISFFESVERIEAIILSLMMLSDFTIVSLFILCSAKAAKTAYSLKERINFDLFLLAAFTVSLIFSFNSMRLNEISESVIVPVNLSVGAGIPALTLAMMLIRKKIAKRKGIQPG